MISVFRNNKDSKSCLTGHNKTSNFRRNEAILFFFYKGVKLYPNKIRYFFIPFTILELIGQSGVILQL